MSDGEGTFPAIGPDNGGDRLHCGGEFAFSVFERAKLLLMLLIGARLTIHIEVDTQHAIGVTRVHMMQMDHRLAWLLTPQHEGAYVVTDYGSDEERVQHELRLIDEHNTRPWWQRMKERMKQRWH